MSKMPEILDVSTIIIVPGELFQNTGRYQDIIMLRFKCWTAQGQLVEAVPNGHIFYLHHGLHFLFPVNVVHFTSLPIHWKNNMPWLGAPQDLQPQFDTPDIEVNVHNCFPIEKFVRTTGPALDLILQLAPAAKSVVSQIEECSGTVRLTKAVNAFIAYRSLYAPFIPLGRQMEISSVVRHMWSFELPASKYKFAVAAKLYTLERDHHISQGTTRVPLAKYMYNNCRRFQVSPPEIHIIEHALYTMDDDDLGGIREALIGDDAVRFFFPPGESREEYIDVGEMVDNYEQDVDFMGNDAVLQRYYDVNPHFAPFNFEYAIRYTEIIQASQRCSEEISSSTNVMNPNFNAVF